MLKNWRRYRTDTSLTTNTIQQNYLILAFSFAVISVTGRAVVSVHRFRFRGCVFESDFMHQFFGGCLFNTCAKTFSVTAASTGISPVCVIVQFADVQNWVSNT